MSEPAPIEAQAAPYLAALNPAQRAAVESVDGPVLVLAGAGTGKTRVLTTRLVHILATRKAFASQIMAVTFTNKAAKEMQTRVGQMVGQSVDGWWLGTFHSLAARLLRRHAELVGLKSNFTILDTDDQQRLIKQLLQAENIDDKKWPPRLVLSAIDRWKDRALTPDKLKADDAGDLAGGRAVAIYALYQQRLKELNACDFGDLLLHTIVIFQDASNGVLADCHRRFRYLLVDEYQDTNVAQYLWLRLLAQGNHNICCVGDDDQSIYGWRGAEIGNILRFEKDFPGATIVRLEQNYRSTSHILAAASGVIANNQGRLGKTLWTDAEGGERVRVRALWDGQEEARWVGDEVEALQRAQVKLDSMAILVRAGFQTRAFEERFITLGLPYRVVGGARFYERQEIRDALAYFRVVVQPQDDLAFERIINKPKRGIGDSTIATLHQAARTMRVPMTETVLHLVETDELKPKMRSTLRQVMMDIARWRQALQTTSHVEVAKIILDESGYTGMWQADKTPEAAGRLENLKELVSAMGEFESMEGFLEHVSLVMEAQDNSQGDMISLMTLHGAKGLEFDIVFLPGWEEGVFPNQRAIDESGIAGLEEERRLAYVGLTRARQRAFISHAANRQIFGSWMASQPSRFVNELPADVIETEGDPGLAVDHQSMMAQQFSTQFNQMAKRIPARMPMHAEPSSFGLAARARPAVPFEKGQRVFHQKFGYGTIMWIDNDKLEIEFDSAGMKKVMDSFVSAAEGTK
jgi:DNA helicase-2/ATP-dependent DNA helicase PcrA